MSFLGNPYVLLAIGLALLGLAGYGAYEHQRGNAADARAALAESISVQLRESLAESEAAQEALRAASKRLDEAVRERDKRLAALVVAKRNLDAEYAKLKEQVGAEDRSCLDRALPDIYVERLRNGSADGDKDGATASPRGPAVAVPAQ